MARSNSIMKDELTTDQICELMPKVELHAHLNGSITDYIIHKLRLRQQQRVVSSNSYSTSKNYNEDEPPGRLCKLDCNKVTDRDMVRLDMVAPQDRSLTECWKAFAKIHEVIRTPDILFHATCEVIEDFVKDNVIYLELRTTPKKVHEIPSKQVYIETVIKAIKYCTDKRKLPITVKLLISIDRGNSARRYLENVCLVQWYRITSPEIVVGLDLCGDPTKGNTSQVLFALNFSKWLGQRVSVHLPEVINVKDTKLLLEHLPNRVAHGQYLHPSTGGNEELWTILKNSGICMETCITSNLISGVSPSLEQHYVKLLYYDGIPFILCTDDCGVFNSKLSQEYKKFLQLVPNLSKMKLKDLCLRSTTYIFGSNVERSKLAQQMECWWKLHVNN